MSKSKAGHQLQLLLPISGKHVNVVVAPEKPAPKVTYSDVVNALKSKGLVKPAQKG